MSGSFSCVTRDFVSPRVGVGCREIRSRFRCRSCFELFELEFIVVPEDMERTIQPSPDRHFLPGWWHGGGGWEDLDELSFQRDSVVVVDGTNGLEAEDVLEIESYGGAVDIGKMILAREASVMVPEIGVLEEAVALIDGGNMVAPKCLDEAVLMRAIGAFHTALGLRGSGIDDGDSEPGECPGDIGEAVPPGIVHRTEIHVKLPGNAISLHIHLEDRQDVLTVL